MLNGNQSVRATDYSINSGLNWSASPSEIHTNFLNPLIPCSFSLSSQILYIYIYIYILYIYIYIIYIYMLYTYIYNKYNIYIISNEFENGRVLIKIQ